MFTPGKDSTDFSALLKELVSDGTITQATADKITAYQNDQQAARQAKMDKLKNMTAEQRKAYFDANKPSKDNTSKKPSPFDGMVQQGILTQQQADSIMQKLHDKQEANEQTALKTQLDKLVTAKTITQDQATKVLDYMNKLDSDRDAEMQKVQAMTQAERDAYFKSQAGQKQDPLAQLVTNGTLTQHQLNAVQRALHHQKSGHPMHKGVPSNTAQQQ
jgi:predicted transcriptional regulator